jgi:hypothetical protein
LQYSAAVPAPACPRCAYDLSGTVATWHDSCPLTGLCSECGLDFDWADVHDPDRNRVRGLFEHARGPWQAARWLELTWLLTLWPPRFWRKVRLESPVNARRAALWPFLITLVVWATGSILCNASLLADVYRAGPRGWRPTPNEVLAGLCNGWIDPIAAVERWRLGVWKFRWSPDFHAWVRYFAPLIAMSISWLLLMLVLPSTLRAARIRRAHVVRAFGYSLAWLPALALTHLADGLWLAMRSALSTPSAMGLPTFMPVLPTWYMRDAWLPIFLVLTAWLLLWWWCALAGGFRLRHAGRIWLTLAFASTLAWAIGLIACGGLAYLMMEYEWV